MRRRAADTHPELASQDHSGDDDRHPFAKDRDRLLYASSLHRLERKSQIVASTEHGQFHTRSTHSHKVAQLGRRLAETLRARDAIEHGRTFKFDSDQILAPDPDLVEFACLAHDLGHPPFGHNGERELNATVDRLVSKAERSSAQEDKDKMRAQFGGFQGNAQSFRIVTRLSHKWLLDDGREAQDYPSYWYGLDVTAASMDAMSKYPRPRGDVHNKKWGVYAGSQGASDDLSRWDGSDQIALSWARAHTGAAADDTQQQSFECQIMDWCDDVTYAVHDVEDFYMTGMIPLDRIFASSLRVDTTAVEPGGGNLLPTPEWEEFRDYVCNKWSGTPGRDEPATEDYLDSLRAGLMSAASALRLWDWDRRSSLGRRASHERVNSLIQYFIAELTVEGSPMLHEGELHVAASADRCRELQDQCNLLKELAWKYVIDLPTLNTQRAGQRRIIRDLVEIHADSSELLPRYYQELIEYDGVGYEGGSVQTDDEFLKIRTAADYVASLAEPHAIALHKRLSGAELGSFRDLI